MKMTKAKLIGEFEVCWHVIRKNTKRAAEIVAEIKERGLYKPKTWAAFCQEDLGITRQSAEEFLLFLEVSAIADVVNVGQARALRGADPETAAAAVQLAGDDKTAERIKSARELLEEETEGLAGEEKTRKTAEVLRREEQRARSAPRERSRKGAILGILGDVQKRLARCRREHEGLTDVADACDRQMRNVENELEAYETLVRGSREEAG